MSRPLWRYVSVIALSGALGCSTASEDGSQGDSPAARPHSGGASRETATSVMNTFPIKRGDVRSAIVRAAARFAPLPASGAGPAPGVNPIDGTANMSPSGAAATPAGTGTLVLYDTTGEWGWLGELYAINVASLVSHFGAWTARPASDYHAGDMAAYAGVIYVGSTFDEPLPTALLDDVLGGTRPVMWIDDNIWQLAARSPTFAATYGFMPFEYDTGDVAEVDYKGTALTRYMDPGVGIMTYSEVTTAKVLADAVHTNGAKSPWALRGSNLLYIGENPMSYVTSDDRYLAFCDLLFEVLASDTPERHRALVRIEDVSATTSPAALRAIADYLSSQSVPFSVATIPQYLDPLGAENDGVPRSISLRQAPSVASALRYMVSKGGTLIMHGYTHQFDAVANPYDGVSADDFEFYTAHVDAANYVVYDGPVPGDSRAWAAGRIAAGLHGFMAASLPTPTIFEFPHYAGSVEDSRAVRSSFSTVYHRGLYFGGMLTGAPPDYTHDIGVTYPFAAQDLFGFKVIPEDLGSYEPLPMNNNPPRLVADLLHTAHTSHVIRDGFASFYFHPYYPLSVLKQTVSGIKAAGYTFVAPSSL